MLKSFRAFAMLSTLTGVIALGSLPLVVAQEQGAAKSDEGAITKSRRVPRYFGQIGLTPEQRESIYKIQGKHEAKINALEKQIADARAEMLKECESVLTDTQKQLLEQRRKAAGAKGKAAADAPEK